MHWHARRGDHLARHRQCFAADAAGLAIQSGFDRTSAAEQRLAIIASD